MKILLELKEPERRDILKLLDWLAEEIRIYGGPKEIPREVGLSSERILELTNDLRAAFNVMTIK